jgi:hypothetical protein
MGWLPDVDPGSFISCGDGHFGHDKVQVYCGNKKLPKAQPGTWAKVGGLYSRDGDRVYYLNKLLNGADADSFWVAPQPGPYSQLARDKSCCYDRGNVIEASEFEAQLSKYPVKDT